MTTCVRLKLRGEHVWDLIENRLKFCSAFSQWPGQFQSGAEVEATARSSTARYR